MLAFLIAHGFLYVYIENSVSLVFEIGLRIQYSVNYVLFLLYEHFIIEINLFSILKIEKNEFFCYLLISYDEFLFHLRGLITQIIHD